MLHNISLRLARSHDYPDGSDRHGYEITAPLDAEGQLDATSWREVRDRCRVRRIWAGAPERRGRLVHRAGGAGGATWIIDYDDRSREDDEIGFKLERHQFVEGEYVSIRDDDGGMHTFRVARVGRA